MASKKKIALLGLLGLGLGAAAFGAAKAADDDDGDDDGGDDVPPEVCPPGFHAVILPNAQGIPQQTCVPDAEPDDPPPPPPGPGHAKNYVGSGYNWPHKNDFPMEASFGAQLLVFGYPAAAVNPAMPGWSVISGPMMSAVREFQRDYNAARLAQTVDVPAPKKLDTDGLIGANTINGLLNAKRWQQVLNLPWIDIVGLA
jgi:hypothetical protein